MSENDLKISLLKALEYIQEITNYDMEEVETLLGLEVDTYLELIGSLKLLSI